ncbi:cinnamyl alcohol dehydrogenase [Artemisia annua]|uniref:Cinnamyl alcohol dehydrogenase n=1 Tax=Artemisia annua TaxID=35608 RepID=A0A2U1NT19_ARTAN|nr:cinnamyl alcohol dehydrogenase [Artemisia annua]
MPVKPLSMHTVIPSIDVDDSTFLQYAELVNSTQLHILADSDEHEVVQQVQTSQVRKAIERLKADHFMKNNDSEQMMAAMRTLDGLIDTVYANHAVEQLVRLLKPQGKLIVVGVPDKSLEVPPISLVSVN